jgi:hypothetical protein
MSVSRLDLRSRRSISGASRRALLHRGRQGDARDAHIAGRREIRDNVGLPTPTAKLDIDGLVYELADEFAGYGFDSYHHYETRVLHRHINWKLVVDTFLESYHIGVLHRETISPLFYANRSTFNGFGCNLRWTLPRRTIGELRALPEQQWDLIAHTAIVYLLFPNTILVMAQDHLETWHMFPAGNGIDETRMYVSLYIPQPALTDSARRHWNNNFDLLMATVENQDFPVSEGIQRGFYSGAQEEIVFGRNEPALQHYHRSIRAALAPSADEQTSRALSENSKPSILPSWAKQSCSAPAPPPEWSQDLTSEGI